MVALTGSLRATDCHKAIPGGAQPPGAATVRAEPSANDAPWRRKGNNPNRPASESRSLAVSELSKPPPQMIEVIGAGCGLLGWRGRAKHDLRYRRRRLELA